ncbi:MAG: PEP-CTERM system TPR-repeat protein PrsT [Proteobacteria bacterium]|nr:PEP-CTERM system TPR-repeat protein PrsT [Pseudomonadota bacterium]
MRELDHVELDPKAAASVLATKAASELAQGEVRRAKSLVKSALSKEPESNEAQLVSAQILASENDLNGAIVKVESILSRDVRYAPAWSLLGDLRLRQQKLEEALLAYGKAVSADKNNYTALYKRAHVSLQMQKFDAAQADISTILRIAPLHAGANFIQGVIHFQAKRYAPAIESLSVAEPAFNQFPVVLFFLGSAQLLEGKVDQAGVQAARFYDLVPDSIRGRKLLATIRLQQGKFGDVEELLQPVLDANPDDADALNLAANALLREGRTDEGITLLSRVAELQPDSPTAQVRLGAGLLMGGQGDDAAQHMETALSLDPEFQQADILLVLNYVQNKDYPAAIAAAEDYKRRNMVSVTPYNLLGRVYLEAGQQDKAKESFEKALILDSGDPGANHNLAQLAVSNNDIAQARKYYATILEHHENFLPALIQLALLDAKEGDEVSLVAHLERGIEANPTALQPRLLLGRYYLSKNRPDQVAPLFSSMEEAQRRNPQVLHLLAMSQLASKDPKAAQYTLEQLTETMPESAAVHHMMAMAAGDDMEKAQSELHKALDLDENFLPARIALARLALANKSDAEFRQHLEKLQSLAPQDPDVLLLRAADASSHDDIDQAVSLAEEALEVAPSTKTVISLAFYKEAGGDIAGAVEVYDRWIAGHPADIPVRIAVANTLQVSGQIDKAIGHYEEILRTDKDNLVSLNNLAWFIREENPEKALEYARRAREINPESSDVLDTLAVVEYINKDFERAKRSIERALELSPETPALIYHNAMIAVALGDKSAAEAILIKLLAEGNEFPERVDAKALLAELTR